MGGTAGAEPAPPPEEGDVRLAVSPPGADSLERSGAGEGGVRRAGATGGRRKRLHGPCRPGPRRRVTYFRHKARDGPGSLSADPSVVKNVKGQASSMAARTSSSRMGKSVSVMKAIWEDRGEVVRNGPDSVWEGARSRRGDAVPASHGGARGQDVLQGLSGCTAVPTAGACIPTPEALWGRPAHTPESQDHTGACAALRLLRRRGCGSAGGQQGRHDSPPQDVTAGSPAENGAQPAPSKRAALVGVMPWEGLRGDGHMGFTRGPRSGTDTVASRP